MHPAPLTWQNDKTPRSVLFNDLYFSKTNGIAETEHVFIHPNRLVERFQTCNHFTIGETGFGTGLNFFVTTNVWQQHAPAHATLDYISVEKYPLALADLAQVYQQHPQWKGLCDQLLVQYPPAVPGFYTLLFPAQRIRLLLLFGDATERLSELVARVDAWYLDGFAPSKNPEMWTPALFQQLARLSHTGTTLSSFTSATLVRQGLTDAGFDIHKGKGFGNKREMLRGIFSKKFEKIC